MSSYDMEKFRIGCGLVLASLGFLWTGFIIYAVVHFVFKFW